MVVKDSGSQVLSQVQVLFVEGEEVIPTPHLRFVERAVTVDDNLVATKFILQQWWVSDVEHLYKNPNKLSWEQMDCGSWRDVEVARE